MRPASLSMSQGDGVIPFSSIFCRTKASTGLKEFGVAGFASHETVFTVGNFVGFFTG